MGKIRKPKVGMFPGGPHPLPTDVLLTEILDYNNIIKGIDAGTVKIDEKSMKGIWDIIKHPKLKNLIIEHIMRRKIKGSR